MTLPMRDGLWPYRCRALPVAPVIAGLRHPDRLAGAPYAQLRCQLNDALVGHRVDLSSVTALWERVSKSAKFCLEIHHGAGLGQLLLQSLLLDLQPGDLLGLRVAPLAPAWGGQPR